MRQHRIAAIPADGIGPEVIAAGLEALDAVAARDGGFSLTVDHYDWGSARYRRLGALMPEDGLAQLRGANAIYFGAVGAPDIPDHVTLWGLRLPICQGFDQYANVRPTRILPGVTSPLRNVGPGDLDWLIVRENSEGEYAGHGGRAHRGLPEEVATEVAIFTRVGVERIMRFAFDQARARPRKHLTIVTKSNAQRYGMVFWDEIAAMVAADYPDVAWDKELVDAMTMRMVNKPRSVDTVVATNLHADILSDLAAALAGSLGIAPTGNVDPQRRFPSMFEPIHGSAFDITGKGIANPVASFWTAVMMLDHLGEAAAARMLMAAVEQVCAAGLLTPDLGGRATTAEVTRAVCEANPRGQPVIRQAGAADLPLVRAIALAAYEPYETSIGLVPLPTHEDYAPRIADGEVWLLGQEAMLVLERHADHAMIYSVAVRPDCQHQGLGSRLLTEAERLAGALPEIRLYTNALMLQNIALYARRGYVETGRRPHPARPDMTVVDMAKTLRTAEAELGRLLGIMARLRAADGCPWDREQDFDSIAPYTIEEAYEVADAIARRDWAGLPGELGDLLFQVVYHARLAEEAGRFDFAAVARGIADKMVRRHPHVFAGATVQPGFWEAQKSAERSGGTLAGVAVALPALTRAAKLTARAARVGFDWPDAPAVLDKLAEETAELRAELTQADPARLADELGDMLFVLANLARKLAVDPERCLAAANAKFSRRFAAVELILAAEGTTPGEAGLDAMEAAWAAVKRAERASEAPG